MKRKLEMNGDTSQQVISKILKDLIDPDPLNFFENKFIDTKGIKSNHVHDFKNTFGYVYTCHCGKSEIRMPPPTFAEYVANSWVIRK